jgi:hypothetical protein
MLALVSTKVFFRNFDSYSVIMKVLSLVLLLWLTVLTVSAQDSLSAPPKSGQWRLSAGGFGGVCNGNAFYGSYLAPGYSLNLSDKFSVQAGILFTTFSVPSLYNVEGGSQRPGMMNATFVYTQGTYKLNDKFFITGGAYTSLDKTALNTPSGPQMNSQVRGGKVGIGYNIKEGSTVYFEMNINQGNSPFNMYRNPYSSPFSSPFSTPFPGH